MVPCSRFWLNGSDFAVLASTVLASQLPSWFSRLGVKLTGSELFVLVSRFPRPQFWLHDCKLTVSGPVVMASQFWICGSGFAVPAVMILDSPHSSRVHGSCGS